VRVEPLALGLDLATHLKERNTRHTMASCFDAFVLAIENIQAHYGSIEAEANQAHPQYDPHVPHIQKTRGYPFLTSYNDGGQETRFTYDRRLEEDKLVFSATVDQPGSGKCIVKFTCQYSEAAHNYLASRDLAPMIRKCVRISADWTAIVMDKSTYRVLYGLQLSEAQRTKVKCKVKSIVETLHEGGFVHGDIRDANLLIDEASLTSNDVAVHLIDFDWAGCTGEAKYPMGTNCKTVRRPAGVKGGEVVTEQHDVEMVSYLFSN
jgi:serine/threonine protein kinase